MSLTRHEPPHTLSTIKEELRDWLQSTLTHEQLLALFKKAASEDQTSYRQLIDTYHFDLQDLAGPAHTSHAHFEMLLDMGLLPKALISHPLHPEQQTPFLQAILKHGKLGVFFAFLRRGFLPTKDHTEHLKIVKKVSSTKNKIKIATLELLLYIEKQNKKLLALNDIHSSLPRDVEKITLTKEKLKAAYAIRAILLFNNDPPNTAPFFLAYNTNIKSKIREIHRKLYENKDLPIDMLNKMKKLGEPALGEHRPKIKENCNSLNSTGQAKLHVAVLDSDMDTLTSLLSDPNILPNARNTQGQTALHLAAQSGQTTFVKLLLEHALIYVNGTDSDGRTPLHCALQFGHEDTARLLLDEMDNLETFVDHDGNTLLHSAAMGGSSAMITHLLAIGLNHNQANRKHLQPLFYAKSEAIALQLKSAKPVEEIRLPTIGYESHKQLTHNISCPKELIALDLLLYMATITNEINSLQNSIDSYRHEKHDIIPLLSDLNQKINKLTFARLIFRILANDTLPANIPVDFLPSNTLDGRFGKLFRKITAPETAIPTFYKAKIKGLLFHNEYTIIAKNRLTNITQQKNALSHERGLFEL